MNELAEALNVFEESIAHMLEFEDAYYPIDSNEIVLVVFGGEHAAAVQQLLVDMHEAHVKTESKAEYWYKAWHELATRYNDLGLEEGNYED